MGSVSDPRDFLHKYVHPCTSYNQRFDILMESTEKELQSLVRLIASVKHFPVKSDAKVVNLVKSFSDRLQDLKYGRFMFTMYIEELKYLIHFALQHEVEQNIKLKWTSY